MTTKLMNLSDINTMSSREIAELTGKRHDNVLRDCEVLNESYAEMGLLKIEEALYIHAQNGQTYKEFLLTKMQTMDLMTGYNIELRIRVNRRWEELESTSQFRIPQTLSEALMFAAKQVEEKEQLRLQVEEQAEKVEYHDTMLDSTGTMPITSIAKCFGMSGQALNRILEQHRIQYKRGYQWYLYAKYQDKGYVKSVPYPYEDYHTRTTKTRQETRWTEKGKKFIYTFLASIGVLEVESVA